MTHRAASAINKSTLAFLARISDGRSGHATSGTNTAAHLYILVFIFGKCARFLDTATVDRQDPWLPIIFLSEPDLLAVQNRRMWTRGKWFANEFASLRPHIRESRAAPNRNTRWMIDKAIVSSSMSITWSRPVMDLVKCELSRRMWTKLKLLPASTAQLLPDGGRSQRDAEHLFTIYLSIYRVTTQPLVFLRQFRSRTYLSTRRRARRSGFYQQGRAMRRALIRSGPASEAELPEHCPPAVAKAREAWNGDWGID